MPTRYRKLLTLAAVLLALGIVAAACQAEPPAGDCLTPEDGMLVPSDCEIPEGVTANPTATPIPVTPTAGGGDSAVGLLQNYGCGSCHTIDGTSLAGAVGPNLTQIGAEGADHIRQSIIDPSAVLADDCPGGPCSDLMPKNFGTAIPQEDLDAIVDYLAGLQ